MRDSGVPRLLGSGSRGSVVEASGVFKWVPGHLEKLLGGCGNKQGASKGRFNELPDVQAGFQVFLMKIVIIKVQVIFKGSGRSSNQSCF